MKNVLAIAFSLFASIILLAKPINSSIAARSSSGMVDDSLVPNRYKVVSGIGATKNGISIVETGVFNDYAWRLTTRVVVIEAHNNNMRPLFGAQYSSGWSGYGIIRYGDGLASGNGGRVVYSNTQSGKVCKLFANGNAVNVDFYCEEGSCTLTMDNTYSCVASNQSIALNGNQIYLFGLSPTYVRNPTDIIEETIIEQNGEVVADLVPCIRLSDNEPVFYDIVQKVERHDLSGTGKLVAYEY